MIPIRDHEPSRVTPYVTIGIIALNVWVFFREIVSPNIERFFQDWALVPSLVDVGDPSTLLPFITSQFVHGGIAHILFNMWYLWIFGDNVEGRLGHFRYLGFYLLSGIIAGVVQFFFLVGSDIPMLGASGAVAGVLGAYWVFFPRHRVDTLLPYFGFWSRATLPASGVLLFWFVGQLFSGVGSLAAGAGAGGGVAWWAHISGFAFGWLIARMLGPERRAEHARLHQHPQRDEADTTDLWK